ncbi:glycosyltransferase [Parvibaculum sp.]|uniref:glycosyltransferase family 2 protein n=1 Tax=Parvibaculum sp. TaxID=2024848 RepID=UPI001D7F0595|nr:glycosyltransferase [Parvibaculum sp.]MBX3489213.1 glycosyltransferase [Parvibaculum sp.]
MAGLNLSADKFDEELRAVPLRERQFDNDEEVIVSICTITYNHAAYLRQCLEGFLDQVCSFRVEIIIYDDASTDGTSDIVREYASRYPSVVNACVAESNSYSLGVNPYYAFAFPKAKGRYVAICDGDDFWNDLMKLAVQVDFLERNPDTVITYGPACVEIDGVIQKEMSLGSHRDLTASELRAGASINTLTACFRNPRLQTPPPFLRISPIGDVTVWALLGYRGSGKFLLNLEPAVYRIHGGGVFSGRPSNTKYYMSLLAHISIAAYHSEHADLQSERARLDRALSMIVGRMGAGRVLFNVLKELPNFAMKRLRVFVMRIAKSDW